ncbi:3'-5' exonuclease [Paraglaciecola aquimarina]|uniref:3'-5' exonuclease n=1 Tax=Paraglaciecola aquimarina TaxID=1235557 RepID=A0ABU3SZ18_9ALTE|nr:3'-5' exonuclease [Paraglaciecola aquimarina]MDU0355260.1 3'-5' exonuclease [Paraglaciecola aquimarina]
MAALNLSFGYFNVEQVLVSQYKDGLRRITNLRHLVELLQQQSLKLQGEAELIHWFESCLLEPDHNSESQQLRLESDSNLVQIVTLHASKGLEFPLVFIPFGPSFKSSKNALYHNEQEQLEVDFLNSDQAVFKAEYERLAEDIRLFYVAVTRAVYYCNIGIWNINLAPSKKLSGFTQSALGCLLLSELEPSDAEVNGTISNQHIHQSIAELTKHCDVSYRALSQIEPLSQGYIDDAKQVDMSLHCLQLDHKVQRTWRLTSYSAISRQQIHVDMPTPGLDEGQDLNQQKIHHQEQTLELTDLKSPFTFERGANAGSFLHGVLENIDFQQLDNLAEVIQQQSVKFAIDPSWQECLHTWLTEVVHSPINRQLPQSVEQDNSTELALFKLSKEQVKVEMEFYMPLHKVQVHDFNRVINQYFPQHYRHYQFETLNGMIKGYIDLMFEFDGQYYVADYKSNHLGDDHQSYNEAAMEKGMTEHDYHLQAILYTLALHRWLKNRLPAYKYEKHIGGAYYLFIRGMSTNISLQGNGVYYLKPEQSLIESLDRLFDGKADELTTNTQAQVSKNQTEGQLDLW